MIDLTKFCGPKDWNKNIHEPFTVGDWTYATDGRICIRVPQRKGIGENPNRDIVDKCQWLFLSPEKVVKWVEVLPVDVRQKHCDLCNGWGDCEDCDGAGKVDINEEIEFALDKNHVILLSNVYLRLIGENLPNAEIGLVKTALAPVRIKFDGGEGVLMPMRK